MVGPHQHVTPLRLAQAAIFNGKGFEDAAGYARYLLKFQDCPLSPSITLDPSRFNKQEGEASNSRNQMLEDEDAISDYVASPEYAF
ncbi:unnamed protein product [Linum trigynum]|uniref:Uncharacterized protein n=1 Tax=Linum trigynum TaxID=586398 RepID=A0AAV2G849_9ROSI